jgi:hypothetical protein
MIVQAIRFTSTLPPDEIIEVTRVRANELRDLPGLIQKFYGVDGDGAWTAIYVFDSAESLTAFEQTDLARSIPDVYQTQGLRIENYEFVGALRPDTPSLETV